MKNESQGCRITTTSTMLGLVSLLAISSSMIVAVVGGGYYESIHGLGSLIVIIMILWLVCGNIGLRHYDPDLVGASITLWIVYVISVIVGFKLSRTDSNLAHWLFWVGACSGFAFLFSIEDIDEDIRNDQPDHDGQEYIKSITHEANDMNNATEQLSTQS